MNLDYNDTYAFLNNIDNNEVDKLKLVRLDNDELYIEIYFSIIKLLKSLIYSDILTDGVINMYAAKIHSLINKIENVSYLNDTLSLITNLDAKQADMAIKEIRSANELYGKESIYGRLQTLCNVVNNINKKREDKVKKYYLQSSN